MTAHVLEKVVERVSKAVVHFSNPSRTVAHRVNSKGIPSFRNDLETDARENFFQFI